jgi:uncharacterized protein YdeI (YjbR/CyaY-like superfamily)
VAIEQTAPDGKPMLTVDDADDLDEWLAGEHARPAGVWLVRARPGSDHPSVDYEDMISVLLCYGWVDASIKVLDGRRSLLWISPRRKGSVWSKPNKQRLERLAAQGRIRPSGQAVIDRAKSDGSWTTIDGAENLEVPDDLAAALDGDPVARANFDAFPPSSRKGYLGSIAMAKRADTRARRIALTVQRSRDNLRPGA